MNPLDISDHYNHKFLISKNEELRPEDVGVCGNFWEKQLFIQALENSKIPYITNGYNDNIACMSQEIRIEKEVSKILLFGFAEWGDYHEDIVIKSGNEYFSKKICFCEFHHNNKNVWTGEKMKECKCRFTLATNLRERVGLYQVSVVLKSCLLINYVVLPENPAIHIFSITI